MKKSKTTTTKQNKNKTHSWKIKKKFKFQFVNKFYMKHKKKKLSKINCSWQANCMHLQHFSRLAFTQPLKIKLSWPDEYHHRYAIPVINSPKDSLCMLTEWRDLLNGCTKGKVYNLKNRKQNDLWKAKVNKNKFRM